MDVPRVAIKKILYSTDLSETGRYAFAFAASLANVYDAELTVLHVVEEEPDLYKKLSGYMKEELLEELKKRDLEDAGEVLLSRKRENSAIMKKCIGEYCEQLQGSVPEDAYVHYDIVVKSGHPVEQITEYANTEKFNLIVIGSHGHGTLKDAVMGDTARRVLRRAKIPVLVVRIPEE